MKLVAIKGSEAHAKGMQLLKEMQQADQKLKDLLKQFNIDGYNHWPFVAAGGTPMYFFAELSETDNLRNTLGLVLDGIEQDKGRFEFDRRLKGYKQAVKLFNEIPVVYRRRINEFLKIGEEHLCGYAFNPETGFFGLKTHKHLVKEIPEGFKEVNDSEWTELTSRSLT